MVTLRLKHKNPAMLKDNGQNEADFLVLSDRRMKYETAYDSLEERSSFPEYCSLMESS